jgi:MFS family permease
VLLSQRRSVRVWGTVGLCLAAVAIAAVMQMTAPAESAEYQRVALTRTYWFLSQWRWYELIGLVAPLLILSVVALGGRKDEDAARVGLARMAMTAGVIAATVAMLFARMGSATHLVARLQPLRTFQLVYVVMILTLGGWLAEQVLRRRAWRWLAVFSLLAGVMVYAERTTFPASKHLELPGMLTWNAHDSSGNEWEQAFVWISRNTPKDAMFALDAEYITRPGEDAQGFRAIAERSVLPDYSKDGGLVANKPGLTAAWSQGQVAQKGLSEEPDSRRSAELRPLGVTWVVLARSAATGFVCAYTNDAVKVCRLP